MKTQDWGNFLRVALVTFSKIINRYSNLTDDDYLLFPFVKDIKKLKNKVGKPFPDFLKT